MTREEFEQAIDDALDAAFSQGDAMHGTTRQYEEARQEKHAARAVLLAAYETLTSRERAA